MAEGKPESGERTGIAVFFQRFARRGMRILEKLDQGGMLRRNLFSMILSRKRSMG